MQYIFMPARASPSGFAVPYTFQFHPLVVSLSDMQERAGTCFQELISTHPRTHLQLKGLKQRNPPTDKKYL